MSDNLAPVLRVAALVKLAVEQAAALATANASVASAKENLRRTLMDDLPELMSELTLSEIKLEDGTEVSVVPEVDCAITEVNREKAHAWLREHGFGGLIKTAVSVSFGRDEVELRDKTIELLTESLEGTDHEPELNEAVHPATLKSFVKERLAAAAEHPEHVPPTDLFSIFPYSKAKVTPPKAKAAPRRKPA